MKYTLFTAFYGLYSGRKCNLRLHLRPERMHRPPLGSFYGYLVCDTDDSTPGLYKGERRRIGKTSVAL